MPPRAIDRARQRLGGFVARHHRLARGVEFAARVIKAQSQQRLTLNAAGVAFWAAIAITPALIATGMIFSQLVNPGDLQEAVDTLRSTAPDSMGALLATQIQVASQTSPSSLSWGLVISLVTVLWAVSTAIYTLVRAVRLAYGLPPQSYISARSWAFAASLAAVLVFGTVVLAAAAGSAWAVSLPEPWRSLAFLLGVVLGLAVGTGVLTVVSRLSAHGDGPDRHWPGAAFGAIGSLAVFIGFGIYLGFATSYQAIYGALASTVILSLVLLVASYVILLGAVINAELSRAPSQTSRSRANSAPA